MTILQYPNSSQALEKNVLTEVIQNEFNFLIMEITFLYKKKVDAMSYVWLVMTSSSLQNAS